MKSTTNILLVEDNPGDVFLINNFLDKADGGQFKVTHVDSLGSALVCLEKTHFDLALLDLSLPDSQGMDTFLSFQKSIPDLPTVILTESDDVALSRYLMQHGAEDYLVKRKINQNWLSSTIHHAIIRFQKNENLHRYEKEYKQELMHRIHTYEDKITCMYGKLKVLETLSFTDGLTDISNRYYFEVAFKQSWLRACRLEQPLSLIMVDIDFFKQFNDSLGHLRGDRCLRQVARALQQSLGQLGAVVARYGGEEFAVVLPNVPVLEAVDVAISLQSRIKNLSIRHPNSAISSWVTASFGVAALVPKPQMPSEYLIYKADRALYVAKKDGRDRITYFRPPAFVTQSLGE